MLARIGPDLAIGGRVEPRGPDVRAVGKDRRQFGEKAATGPGPQAEGALAEEVTA